VPHDSSDLPAQITKEDLVLNFLLHSQLFHVLQRVIHSRATFMLEPLLTLVDIACNANVRCLIDRKSVRFANSRRTQPRLRFSLICVVG